MCRCHPMEKQHVGFLRANQKTLLMAFIVMASIAWIASGIGSIDFGRHWDEPVQADLVKAFKQHKTLLPILSTRDGFYNYPSFLYWISMIGGGVTWVAKKLLGGGASLSNNELSWIWTQATRTILFLIAIVPSVLSLLLLRKLKPFNWLSARFSALLLLSSWQLAYHAKWIAPDALLVPAVCFFILAITWRYNHRSLTGVPGLIASILPACIAGIAASIKYQGAILLASALVCEYQLMVANNARPSDYLRRSFEQLLAFVFFFLLITPGALIQPFDFAKDVMYESRHYATGHGKFLGAPAYDITNSTEYAIRLGSYIFTRLPLSSVFASVLVSLISGFGAYKLFRKDKGLAVSLYLWPVLLFVYYSTRHVFIARNFLLFLPVIAVGFGLGLDSLLERFPGKATGTVGKPNSWIVLAFAALLLASQFYILDSNLGVRAWLKSERGLGSSLADQKLMREFIGNKTSCLYASASVVQRYRIFDEKEHNSPTCREPLYLISTKDLIMANKKSKDQIILRAWPGTGSFHYNFLGPRDVDFDFYPEWIGMSRVLRFSKQEFQGIFYDSAVKSLSVKPYQISRGGSNE